MASIRRYAGIAFDAGLLFVLAYALWSLFSASAEERAHRSRQAARAVDNWAEVAQHGKLLVRSDRRSTIVAFSDFRCPFCRRAARMIDSLEALGELKATVLFRHLPLTSLHADARDLAVIAECAHQHGRFRAFHDAVFTQGQAFSDPSRIAFGEPMEEAQMP